MATYNKLVKFRAYQLRDIEHESQKHSEWLRDCVHSLYSLELSLRERDGFRLEGDMQHSTLSKAGRRLDGYYLHLSRTRLDGPGKIKRGDSMSYFELEEDEDFAEDIFILFVPASGHFLCQSSNYFGLKQLEQYFSDCTNTLTNDPLVYDLAPVVTHDGLAQLTGSRHVQRFKIKVTSSQVITDYNADEYQGALINLANKTQNEFGGSEITIEIANRRQGLMTNAKNSLVSLVSKLKGSSLMLDKAEAKIAPGDDEDSSMKVYDLIENHVNFEARLPINADTRRISLQARRDALRQFFEDDELLRI